MPTETASEITAAEEVIAALRCQILDACETISLLKPHPERSRLGRLLLDAACMVNEWSLYGSMDGSADQDNLRRDKITGTQPYSGSLHVPGSLECS